MINPFVISEYAGPQYFCDREVETREIISRLTNENNLALISPRRLGKTELIRHCFAQPALKDNYYTFIIDIYSTGSLDDFVNVFGRAILDALKPFGRKAWEGFVNVLASVKSEISYDINNNPVWSLGIGSRANPAITLDEIFKYLASADRPCIVAIDEFQQVTHYAEKPNVEATLRTYIQQCTNAHFIFCGSQRHLMSEMFLSPARPFYQSVVLMSLKPIEMVKYRDFAVLKFAERGKTLTAETADEVYERFNGVTSYLQRVMNDLFTRTPEGGMCTVEMIDETIGRLLDMASDGYETILKLMPEKQRNVFIAIAAEGVAKSITSGRFARKYHLTSPSAIASAVRGLLEKDFITQEGGGYVVYDQLFSLWLRRKGII